MNNLLCIHSCTVSPALRDASLVLCVLIRRQNFVQHTAIVIAQLNEAPVKQAQSQHILCIVAAAVVACNSTVYAALLAVYSVLYCCHACATATAAAAVNFRYLSVVQISEALLVHLRNTQQRQNTSQLLRYRSFMQ
eukprot:20492-Heterococcus_DN1.PRE.2